MASQPRTRADQHPSARPGAPAALVRPSRRCRRRPVRPRGRLAGARGAQAGADRDRAGPARGVRRAGAPALRAGAPAAACRSSTHRARSTRATVARCRCAWSTSTRRRRSRSGAVTGSPSWSSSGSRPPDFVEVDDLPDSSRGAGGHGSTGGFAMRLRRKNDGASEVEPSDVDTSGVEPSAVETPDPRPGGPLDIDEIEPDATYIDLGSLLLRDPRRPRAAAAGRRADRRGDDRAPGRRRRASWRCARSPPRAAATCGPTPAGRSPPTPPAGVAPRPSRTVASAPSCSARCR